MSGSSVSGWGTGRGWGPRAPGCLQVDVLLRGGLGPGPGHQEEQAETLGRTRRKGHRGRGVPEAE